MEDEAILDLFFRRDEQAISETAEKYGNRLGRFSSRLTASELDAQECVNDTYLAAWNTIPPARPENYFAFLCRIIRNLSCKRFRHSTAQKRNAELVSLTEELSEILPDQAGSDTGDKELGEILNGFLETLEPSTRMLFVRRYFFADSLTFLATLTSMSENSIATRLFRVRRQLKKYLAKEGYTV